MSNRQDYYRKKLIKLKEKELKSLMYVIKLNELMRFYKERFKENNEKNFENQKIPGKEKIKIKNNNQNE